jgi:hypothetical protein
MYHIAELLIPVLLCLYHYNLSLAISISVQLSYYQHVTDLDTGLLLSDNLHSPFLPTGMLPIGGVRI